MPELPEVETVMHGLRDALLGQSITGVVLGRSGLRWPFPHDLVAKMEARRILSFRRRAKYILMRLDNGWSVLFHLGMSGRMRIGPDDAAAAHAAPPSATSSSAAPVPPRHEHFVLRSGNGMRVGFVDPRRFGAIDLVRTDREESHRLLGGLGLEPLSSELNVSVLMSRLAGRRSAIKGVLLNQRIMVGLGNIYVCEALFRAHIHPERPSGTLTQEEVTALVHAIRAVLSEAIAAGGSSLRDYVHLDGTRGGYQDLHLVYGRNGAQCRSCSLGTIKRIVQSGRSTFYCPNCQK